MAKVSNVMATKVALDMVEASSAVKNLTTLVNSHTQAWKAQTAALRSAGDYVGAAKAKYEGLGNAISAQREKIEALERKQSEMNNIDKKTADQYMELRSKLNQYRSEMDKLDTSTAKGESRSKELAEQIAKTKEQLNGLDTGTVKSAEQFLRYGQQVDRAKAKLASLEAQQQRAAQQIDVENSGVIRLTASMRTQAALATATAERLRSEGNSYQAMGVEVNGLRAKLDSLRQIQLREAELLASTKARSGETSEAYMRQATRVEELGTKIQETRSKLNELNETMSKTPHGWLAGVSARLDNIQGKADRVSTSFGRIFGATAAANMFTGALGSVQAKVGDLTKAGIDYNIEQNKMVATWTTLTGSAKKAGPLVDSINNMSKATGQNVDIVNELEQGFYHLNSSKKQADGMTSSLLNMADAVGLNGDQIKAVEQDMVHGMATGKITQGELNQIGSYFPMIDEAMAKHFNTTVAGMRQMASAGKISAKDLQEVFEQLGNGKYKEAAENMMNSYFGVFRTIQSRAPQLVGDITKPFMNISNPFLKSVRNWVNDKSTDAEFTKLGNQMARSMNQIISAFGGTNVSATKLMDNAIRGLTAGVQKFGDIVSSHHTQIANFFSAFKTGSAAQAKIFASVFMDLSKVMLPVLDTMAKFPKTSAALITSFLLASRAIKTLQAGIKGLETIKTVSGVIGTFGQKIKSIPNRKITKIQVDGAQSTRDLQSYSNRLERIPKTKRTVVSASTTQANRNLGAVQRQAQRVPRAISVRATANTAQAVTSIARVGTTSQTAATLSRTSFTLIGTSAKIASTGLSLIGGPAGAIMLVIQGFQLLYQHSAKFRKFVDGIANTAKSMAGKVGRWFGNMATSAGKHINRMAQSAKRGWNNINRTSQQSSQREIRLHNQMAQRNQRAAQQMWSRLSRSWLQGWNLNNRLTRQGVQQQIQQHRTMSTRIAVFNTQLWNRSRQAFTKGWNDLRNSTRNGTNNINNEFNQMKVAVGQRAQQAMNDAKNHFQRVNDAPGSHYQEMVHRASTGETFMLPAKRNMLFPLQKGDEVLDGERSHKLATMMQMPIPHANGAIGDFFSGLWNGAKELEDIAEDALKNVVGFGKSLFTHFIANITPKSSDSLNGGLKLNLPGFYAEHLKEWMKKQLDDLGSDTPKNGNWAPVVKKALRKNGLPDSEAYVNAWLKQIQTESGGNPKAVQGNIGDINNATGDLAKGLVQTISATFNAYKFPGHGNIFNGYDNLLAGIAYAKAKYGASGMLSVIGHGHGYANGGIATTPSVFGEAGPEMAIPLDTMKSTRAWQLLRQVVNFYSGGQVTNNSTSLTDLSKIEKKFDTVLAQNTALINAIERLIGVTDSANNPTARYRRTQRDINLAQAQSLTGI